jgi:hypothetical protein
VHERVRAALDSVHGVDINPFAVAIARFRLLVAAMAAGGVRTLVEAAKYEWPVHLAVGDSLIKARQLELTLGGVEDGVNDPLASFAYATEDVYEHPEVLQQGRYHVVVGNPPYITVKDGKLNALYRDLYDACTGKYALSVPFAQRFFELAKRGDSDGHGYGLVGQITSNSFTKREFGMKLIEDYFARRVELTEVIDTSGAYIPGHSTPTVILVGMPRAGSRRSNTIRAVRGVQGEPKTPEIPADGLVWKAIVDQIDKPGSTGRWISVDDLDRDRYFGQQPWILADGGLELVKGLEQGVTETLSDLSAVIGMTALTLEDDAFLLPEHSSVRLGFSEDCVRLVNGDEVRDFAIRKSQQMIMSKLWNGDRRDLGPKTMRHLWSYRTSLSRRLYFGQKPEERGLRWFDLGMFFADRHRDPLSITFAEVATHNHFVLDRGGKAFKQTAPVVKLRKEAGEVDYINLLGLLNSSTACAWLKQVCFCKGNATASSGMADQPWSWNYQFNGSNVGRLPVPAAFPAALAAAIDSLSRQLSDVNPVAIATVSTPVMGVLREARASSEASYSRMIALQEELDWQVYALYNLHSENLCVSEDPDDPNIPELALGERAFEIALARRVAAGQASGEWFKRHNSTPITEIPAHWPAPYREVVQKRIDAIESNRAIGMVERPEYKRRWAIEGWDALQEKALRSWLLDRMEKRDHWFDENGQPAILTLARLTDALSRDEDFVSVAKLYAPRKELAKVVSELIADEHVPFLPALRYKPSGLKKRADWEEVWDLQRKEDAAPDEPAKRKVRDSIPVPPKYTSADFLRPSYWRARGKLDVPKERFISYGQTNAATPELYGWAGWDHREQAQALATYFTNTALSTEEITPFLAGLLELQPWLYQWHSEFDILYSGSPADFFAGYRQQKQGEHGLTDDDLRGWRPPAATRGRRAAVKQ